MTRVVRSLHIDTERTWRGGEQQALYLAAGLVRRGHVAEVAGNPDSEYLRRARAASLTAHDVPMRTDFDPAAFRRLRRLLKDGRFDIVHGHTSRGHVMAGTAALWLRSCKVVVTRRVDFSIRRPPLHPGRLKYRHGIDRFIAISGAVRDVLIDGGVKPHRIAVVPSGVDLARLATADAQAVRAEFGVRDGAPLVGAVAHFAWHKGLEYLVDAVPHVLEQHPDARFFLVGDGELAGALKERAARVAPPGTVLFPGFRLDAPSFLQAFDVVATPSVMEALNTTNLDAMALGRPVVATNVGGIPEVITDEETGLLVPPRDAKLLGGAISRLLGNCALAARLGAAARRLVRERFTCDAMVEGTLAVYREVLGEP